MSFEAQKTIVLTKDELKDLESYCALNKFNVDEIIKSSFKQGFSIEKYGLLENMGGIQEKRVEIEVIREKRVEIPVEVIKEVVKIEYVEVPVEKIVEVIKEVIVEKEPNNDIPEAQKIEINTVVNGVISAPTEVDFFSIKDLISISVSTPSFLSKYLSP
jgi:hypothetical protein